MCGLAAFVLFAFIAYSPNLYGEKEERKRKKRKKEKKKEIRKRRDKEKLKGKEKGKELNGKKDLF